MRDDVQLDAWAAELEEILVRIGHRFGRVDLRRRMRAYVHGLLGPVANPQQSLVQLFHPRIRAHIILHDQNNSDRGPPVTNPHHMTAHQLATLGSTLLTSGDSDCDWSTRVCIES
ncbi:hypothetical protein [Streptomyces sp. NPDC059455]|uniref:hypothetical protein n=1 Tax=Streptomyces sp. NPDC059455 TaxID=3346837 RepID=UPI0036C0E988